MTSEETRHHLQDAHQRVMSVAEIQRHLHPTLNADEIEVDSYLSKLCASLALSMVAENQQISVKVMANKGSVRSDSHRKRADRSMRSIMWAAACRVSGWWVKPGLGEM